MNKEEVMENPATSLLVETLEKRWQTYRGELKRCRKEPSEEAIHDLRVATRRLLALVDMLRALIPHPRLRKLRSTLKNQLDNLDDLRDTQVMLVEVSKTVADLPELVPFQDYLVKREKRLLQLAAKAIKNFQIDSVRKRLDSTRKALLQVGSKHDLYLDVLQIVDEAYETTVQRYRKIEPEKPATIHRVRVAFKKFRYMVELVHPLVPNFPEDNFEHMHDYQSLMGGIQDVEVFLSAFNEFVEKDNSYNPETIRQYYHQRHKELIHTFLEEMHQLNVFWRAEAEAPFPWEIRRGLSEPGRKKVKRDVTPEQEEDEKREQVKAEQETET